MFTSGNVSPFWRWFFFPLTQINCLLIVLSSSYGYELQTLLCMPCSSLCNFERFMLTIFHLRAINREKKEPVVFLIFLCWTEWPVFHVLRTAHSFLHVWSSRYCVPMRKFRKLLTQALYEPSDCRKLLIALHYVRRLSTLLAWLTLLCRVQVTE